MPTERRRGIRVLLVAVGTRGDVQPALGLARALRRAGHGVRLCISPNFVDWAQSLGLDAVPLGVEMRAPRQKPGTPVPTLGPEELRKLRESMPDLITDQFDTVGAAVHGCDVIVGANAHQYAAPSIAARAGIGCVTAVYAPLAVPSPELAPPPTPGQPAGAAPLSIEEAWRDTAKRWNERALDRINANRGRLGMASIDDVLDYVLTDHTWLAADPVLAPLPATPGRSMVQTGTWVLEDRRPLPADIEDFLDRGEPPIFVGFGSMPASGDASRHLVDAARAVGRRVIVSKGWADLDVIDAGPDCLAVGDVSHDVLFSRVAAVVHHGGAGTTAAAARAGVPQLVTPMFSDQFYWGSRVAELGVGASLAYATMTGASVAEGLQQVCDPAVASRATQLAGHVRSDGAEVAVRHLEIEYAR